jgi:hypothetical protein
VRVKALRTARLLRREQEPAGSEIRFARREPTPGWDD